MAAPNKALVDAYRRIAQEVLADYSLDPADSYRYTPDELNNAVARLTERTDFDVRSLLKKEGWTDDELEDLEVNLSLSGQPQTYEMGEFPDPDGRSERR